MFCSIELIYKICVQHSSYLFIYRWIIVSETINYAFVIAIFNELTHSDCSFCLFPFHLSMSQVSLFLYLLALCCNIFSTLTSGLLQQEKILQKIHWNCHEKIVKYVERVRWGCWGAKGKGAFSFFILCSSSHIHIVLRWIKARDKLSVCRYIARNRGREDRMRFTIINIFQFKLSSEISYQQHCRQQEKQHKLSSV